MKTIGFTAALALIAAISTPALAGSPDFPGTHGKDGVSQAARDLGSAWGQIVSTAAKNGNPLGRAVQQVKDDFGGSPNPANDNGGGND